MKIAWGAAGLCPARTIAGGFGDPLRVPINEGARRAQRGGRATVAAPVPAFDARESAGARGTGIARSRLMQTRSRRFTCMTVTVLLAAALTGCGPALIGAGADMAASGASGGTTRVASGSRPSNGDAAVVAAGVALMAAGYKLTPPDQRAPNASPMVVTPAHRPPPGRP
jgi:hypothetical protein